MESEDNFFIYNYWSDLMGFSLQIAVFDGEGPIMIEIIHLKVMFQFIRWKVGSYE